MREHHQREAARLAKVSVGSANRILKLLADSEMLYKLNTYDDLAIQDGGVYSEIDA